MGDSRVRADCDQETGKEIRRPRWFSLNSNIKSVFPKATEPAEEKGAHEETGSSSDSLPSPKGRGVFSSHLEDLLKSVSETARKGQHDKQFWGYFQLKSVTAQKSVKDELVDKSTSHLSPIGPTLFRTERDGRGAPDGLPFDKREADESQRRWCNGDTSGARRGSDVKSGFLAITMAASAYILTTSDFHHQKGIAAPIDTDVAESEAMNLMTDLPALRQALLAELQNPSLTSTLLSIAAYSIAAGSEYYRLRNHRRIDHSLTAAICLGLLGGLILGLDAQSTLFRILPWCIIMAILLCAWSQF